MRIIPFKVPLPNLNSGPVFFDNSSSSGYEASLSTYNWSHTFSGTNRGVIINVSIFATGSVSSIDVGGVTATFVRSDTNGVYINEVWRAENPGTGAKTITVTLSASLTSIATASSWVGVDQNNMVEANNGANGSGTDATVAVTTLSNNTYVVAGVSTADTTITETSPLRERQNSTGALGTGAIGDSIIKVTAGSVTTTWTDIAALQSWAIGAVALKPYPATISPTTVFDSVTIAETVTATLVNNVNVFDSATIAESVTISEASKANVFDSVNVSESITAQLVETASVFDSATISESTTPQLVNTASVFDSVNVSESITLQLVNTANVFDSVNISENITIQPYELVTSIFDSVTISESVSLQLVSNTGTVFDSITIAETTSSQLVNIVSVFDSVTVAESTTPQLVNTVNIFDSVTIAETTTPQLVNAISVFDSATISEDTIVTLPAAGVFTVNVSDNIQVSESITVSIPVGTITFSVGDDILVSETITVSIPGVAVTNISLRMMMGMGN